MRKISKKKSNIIILASVLIVAIALGIVLGAYMDNQNEVPCHSLDKPDGITIHYVEDDIEKSKQLSKKEINFLFEAFSDMLKNSSPGESASVALSPSSTFEEPVYSGEIFKHGVNVEFHYNRPRFVEVLIVPPNFYFMDQETKEYGGFVSCSVFCGEVDSLAIVCKDRTSLVQFWGCLDGEYYSSSISSVSCSAEEKSEFFAAVKSCIE